MSNEFVTILQTECPPPKAITRDDESHGDVGLLLRPLPHFSSSSPVSSETLAQCRAQWVEGQFDALKDAKEVWQDPQRKTPYGPLSTSWRTASRVALVNTRISRKVLNGNGCGISDAKQVMRERFGECMPCESTLRKKNDGFRSVAVAMSIHLGRLITPRRAAACFKRSHNQNYALTDYGWSLLQRCGDKSWPPVPESSATPTAHGQAAGACQFRHPPDSQALLAAPECSPSTAGDRLRQKRPAVCPPSPELSMSSSAAGEFSALSDASATVAFGMRKRISESAVGNRIARRSVCDDTDITSPVHPHAGNNVFTERTNAEQPTMMMPSPERVQQLAPAFTAVNNFNEGAAASFGANLSALLIPDELPPDSSQTRLQTDENASFSGTFLASPVHSSLSDQLPDWVMLIPDLEPFSSWSPVDRTDCAHRNQFQAMMDGLL